MEHHVETTRTHHERSSVPDTLHLRCTCGWTSSTHEEHAVERLIREHVASGVPAPPPSTISPD